MMIRLFCILLGSGMLLVGSGGCSRDQLADDSTARATALRDSLDRYQGFVIMTANATAERLVGGDLQPASEVAVLRWRSAAVRAINQTGGQANALTALLETWAVIRALDHHYDRRAENDDDPALDELAKAGDRLVQRIRAIAVQHLGEERVQEIETAVANLEQDLVTAGTGDGGVIFDPTAIVGVREVTELLKLPLAPFSIFTGVDKSADALKSLAGTADRAVRTTNNLPAELRWQTQLLLLEAQDMEAVRRALDSVDRISGAAERIAGTADTLPQRVGQELRTTLADDAAQGQLRQTLGETRSTVHAGEAALAQAEATLAASEQTINRLEAFLDRYAPPDTDDATTDAEPFRIEDYTAALAQAERTTRELRQLITELDETLASKALDQRMAALETAVDQRIAQAESSVNTLIDRAFWRGLIIVLVLVAGMIAAALLRRRRSNEAKPR